MSSTPVRDVPNELREDVEDGDEEVGDGEVVHEVVHPRRRLPAQLPLQRHQHEPIAEQGHQEDDGLWVGKWKISQQNQGRLTNKLLHHRSKVGYTKKG